MLILVCGMQRSGSTLHYQIAKELVERLGAGSGLGWSWDLVTPELTRKGAARSVVKVHSPCEPHERALDRDRVQMLYSYRDLRDSMASLIQKRGPLEPDAFAWNVRDALDSYAHFTRAGRVLISRYEDFTRDIAGEVERIGAFLGLSASASLRDELVRGLDLDAQRRRIASVEWREGQAWDPGSLLHHNHIRDGAVGKWRTVLTPEQVATIHAMAGPWLVERGYATEAEVGVSESAPL